MRAQADRREIPTLLFVQRIERKPHMFIQWMSTLSTADTVLFFLSIVAIFLMLAIPFTLLFSVAIVDEVLSNRFSSLD